jgi:hypothetical protein
MELKTVLAVLGEHGLEGRRLRSSNLIAAGIAGAAGFTALRLLSAMRLRRFARPPMRLAGPEHMSDPPRRWSAAEETSDDVFPAKFPPVLY